MKPANKDSDEKMSHTNTNIICIFDIADVATLSDNVSTIMKTLFIHYFHSLKINNFNLSHLSVNIKNLFADRTRLTSQQGNNITLASYNIVVLKYFAHEKFVIVNESEKTINNEQFTHT